MSELEILVEELKALPPGRFAEAAGFIHQLRARSAEEKRCALDQAYGCLTDQEADQVEAAIQENCERVDAERW